jgi:hypothetical protein
MVLRTGFFTKNHAGQEAVSIKQLPDQRGIDRIGFQLIARL